jgi:hypothetical protein
MTWMLSSTTDFPLLLLEYRRRVPGSAIDDLRRIAIDLRRSRCTGGDASLGDGSISTGDAGSVLIGLSIFISGKLNFLQRSLIRSVATLSERFKSNNNEKIIRLVYNGGSFRSNNTN